jgi:hypothetical protein
VVVVVVVLLLLLLSQQLPHLPVALVAQLHVLDAEGQPLLMDGSNLQQQQQQQQQGSLLSESCKTGHSGICSSSNMMRLLLTAFQAQLTCPQQLISCHDTAAAY